MLKLFPGGSVKAAIDEGRLRLDFSGVLRSEDLQETFVRWGERRCYIPTLRSISLDLAVWPQRSELTLDVLRPCWALGGGECPAVYVFIVPEADVDWYRAYMMGRAAKDGAIMAAFTNDADAQVWGRQRAQVVAAQRAMRWKGIEREQGRPVICRIAGLPMLGRMPYLGALGHQSNPACAQGRGPSETVELQA